MSDYGSYRNEYLITNTFGSYSSANHTYGNTRKYHGLLVVTQDQLLKFNVLNRVIDGYRNVSTELPLATNIYQGGGSGETGKTDIAVPEGYKHQRDFNLKPFPSWNFQLNDVEITKTILLVPHENSLLVKYEFKSEKDGFFTLKPLINFRNIHSVGDGNDMVDNANTPRYESVLMHGDAVVGNHVKINLQNEHSLSIWHSGSDYYKQIETYFRFYYPDEAQRGYQAIEDLIQPGFFEAFVPAGVSNLFFKFSYNNSFSEKPEVIWDREIDRIKSNIHTHNQADSQLPKLNEFRENLENQAVLFINTTNNHSGICAGYHWFDEWSRDTFISLLGLTLATDKLDTAEEILRDWGSHLKNGLLPNRLLFTEMLNSLDSVFWFTVRLYQFSLIKGNFDLAEKLLPNLENVLIQFQKKTHNIEITEDGFLYDNNSNDALTWMDAKVDGKPVIDRSGMAVEIQALWYNYIRIMIILKEQLNDRTHLTYLKDLKVALEKNFEKVFWNSYQNCLFDCVRKDFTDKSIRPNQVIVSYLPFKLLGNRKNKMVLATVEQKLLTDVGLKTLTREDPEYISNYEGDQKQRDFSYHQGTVWPFLLGFYLCAYYETYLKTKSAQNYVVDKLLSFQKELEKQQLNYIPEIFSADDLRPSGCLAQAWSVAMVLETLYHLRNN